MNIASIVPLLMNVKLFGIELIDSIDFFELLVRFAFNFITVYIIVHFFYFPNRQQKEYYFTYVLISTSIFLLCFLLDNVKLQVGFALGLFAIFGIIRYRTNQIPIKEMTYLFIIIGITIINSLANKKVSYAELVASNLLIILVTAIFERKLFVRGENQKTIVYEKIELIKPENRQQLKEDLENRTGLKINKIEIGRINFMRDTARIRIYYHESEKAT